MTDADIDLMAPSEVWGVGVGVGGGWRRGAGDFVLVLFLSEHTEGGLWSSDDTG